MRAAAEAGTGRVGPGRTGPRECGRAPPWPRERFLRRSEGPARPPAARKAEKGGEEKWRPCPPSQQTSPTKEAPASGHLDPPGGGRPSPRQPAAGEAPHTQQARQGGSRRAGAPTEVKAGGLSVGAGRGSGPVDGAGGPGSRPGVPVPSPPPSPPHSHLGRSAGRWQLTAGSPPRRHRGRRLTSPRSVPARGVPATAPPGGHAGRSAGRQGARSGTACLT